MLRLGPTVISLTLKEVEEVEKLRREQRASASNDRITGNPDSQAQPTRISSSASVESSQISNEKGSFSLGSIPAGREPLSASSNRPPVDSGTEETSPGRTESPDGGTRQFRAPTTHDSAGLSFSSPGPRLLAISPRRIPQEARLHLTRPSPTAVESSSAETAHNHSTPIRHALSSTEREARTEPRLGTGLARLARRDGQYSPPATVQAHVLHPHSRPLDLMRPGSIVRSDIDPGRRFRVGGWRRVTDDRDDSSPHIRTPVRRSSLTTNGGPHATTNSPSDTSSVRTIRSMLGIARHRLTPSHLHARAQTQSPASNSPSSVRLHSEGSSRFAALRAPQSQAQDFQILDEEAVFNFQIYDDSLPESIQPQTPQNLPEARHRSQLLGSYTAPERRLSPLPAAAQTSRRQRGPGRRSPSPRGLQTPGLRGLYGGIENTDDLTLFERAEMARGPERGPRET